MHHVHAVSSESKRGHESPATGAVGGHQPPRGCMEWKSSGRAVSDLNYQAISPAMGKDVTDTCRCGQGTVAKSFRRMSSVLVVGDAAVYWDCHIEEKSSRVPARKGATY